MKAFSIPRISLVCGLALGLMVLWAGAAPKSMTATSFIGGWTPGGDCCEDEDQEPCSNGEYQGEDAGCVGGDTWVCIEDENGEMECETVPNSNECRSSEQTPEGWDWVCDDTLDTLCVG